MTADEATRLHRQLLKDQQLVLLNIQRRTAQERHGDVGGVLDSMDAAVQEQQRATTRLVGDAEGERLAAIDRALARIAAGTYGVSEQSGEPIGYDRLSVEPWARLTVAEAQAAEVQQGRGKHSTL